MRTHGHREGTSHTGVCQGVGAKGGTVGEQEVWGRITLGEMPDVGDEGIETATHLCMCVPTQQSCQICTCTPKLKVQFFKIYMSKKREGKQWDKLKDTAYVNLGLSNIGSTCLEMETRKSKSWDCFRKGSKDEQMTHQIRRKTSRQGLKVAELILITRLNLLVMQAGT